MCALLSVVGLRTGPLAQRLLTGAKVASLGLLALAAVLGGGFPDAPPAPAPPGAWTVQALLLAAVVLLFTYDGWSDITLVAGEIRDPARNLWKAVGLGIAILTALYVLVQGAVLSLLTADRAAASTQVLAEAVEAGRLGVLNSGEGNPLIATASQEELIAAAGRRAVDDIQTAQRVVGATGR